MPRLVLAILVLSTACNIFDDGGGFRANNEDVGVDSQPDASSLCDSYCTLMQLSCPDVYTSTRACNARCSDFAEGGIVGDTLNCRLVVAAGAAADPTQCADAGPDSDVCIASDDPCQTLCELEASCPNDQGRDQDTCEMACRASTEESLACALAATSCEELAACRTTDECKTYCDVVASCPQFTDVDCDVWCNEQTTGDQVCLADVVASGDELNCEDVARTTGPCNEPSCSSDCEVCLDNCDRVTRDCPGFDRFLGPAICTDLCSETPCASIVTCGSNPDVCLPVPLTTCEQYCGLMYSYCPDAEVALSADCLATCESLNDVGCHLDRAQEAAVAPDSCELADVRSPECAGQTTECDDICAEGVACGAVAPQVEIICNAVCMTLTSISSCLGQDECANFERCGCDVFTDNSCPTTPQDPSTCRPLGYSGFGFCTFGNGVRGELCDYETETCGSNLVCDVRPCVDNTDCATGSCLDGLCETGLCVQPCRLTPGIDDCGLSNICDPTSPLTAVGVCVAASGPMAAIGSSCSNPGTVCADKAVCVDLANGDQCTRACATDVDCGGIGSCTTLDELPVRVCIP